MKYFWVNIKYDMRCYFNGVKVVFKLGVICFISGICNGVIRYMFMNFWKKIVMKV